MLLLGCWAAGLLAQMVGGMEHRGSPTGGVSGDGAGIHVRIPHGYFAKELKESSDVTLPEVSGSSSFLFLVPSLAIGSANARGSDAAAVTGPVAAVVLTPSVRVAGGLSPAFISTVRTPLGLRSLVGPSRN